MKKIAKVLSILFVMAFVFGASVVTAKPKVIKLSVSTMWGPNMGFMKLVVPEWKRIVKEKTNGQVELVIYGGQTLTKAKEAYQGVVNNISDIAVVGFPLTPGAFPIAESFCIPGIQYNSAYISSKVFEEGLKIFKPAELDDTEVLWTTTTGPGEIITKKGSAVTSFASIQGMELAANAGTKEKALNLIGAAASFIPTPEWLEYLKNDIVKGGIISGECLDGFNHREYSGDNVTVVPYLYLSNFGVVMNKARFNSLSPEIQEALKIMPSNAPGLWDHLNKIGYEKNEKAHQGNVNYILMPEEEHAKFKAAVHPMIEERIQYLNKLGYDGKFIMDTIQSLAKKYNADNPVAPYLTDLLNKQ